jgi:hypothetical protein
MTYNNQQQYIASQSSDISFPSPPLSPPSSSISQNKQQTDSTTTTTTTQPLSSSSSSSSSDEHLLNEIAPGFYNLRGSFVVMKLLDVGTQMSIIKLQSTGKFLVLSTCDISEQAKTELDQLTNNGDLIEGVIATHPFHTLHFKTFYEWYPTVKFYGTPRHLRKLPEIPW